MNDKPKQIDVLPEEFASYDEAAEFWDSHDTTDYHANFEAVTVQSQLKRRRYEIEIDEELMTVLTQLAQQRGVAVNDLVIGMLREKIRPAA